MKKLMLIVIGLLLSFQMLQAIQVEKSVVLKSGYNAIQFDTNVTLDELKEKIGIDNLLMIQGAGQGTTYQKEYEDSGFGFLNSFIQAEQGKALWFKVNQDVTFTYMVESFLPNKRVELGEGWSFVGAIKALTLAEIKEQFGENLLVIQGAEQESTYKKEYEDGDFGFLNSFEQFEEGKGYWIKVAHATSLTFELELETIAKDNSNHNVETVKTINGKSYTVRVYTDSTPTTETSQATIAIYGDINGERVIVSINDSYPTDARFQVKIFDENGEEVGRSDIVDYQVSSIEFNALSLISSNPCITLEDLKTKIANNEDVTQVNTGCITDMSELFKGNTTFNQDIGDWDVSNVTNMSNMFEYAEDFNQDIGDWNVSNVVDMHWMFFEANTFNKPIESWNVSNVTNMRGMFFRAHNFNQPLEKWDVSKVIDMGYMFGSPLSQINIFNQPIGKWDVSNVSNMSEMFSNNSIFNQDIGEWNVSNVTDMHRMFCDALSFNQPIENWNVSNVTDMSYMFNNANNFNQDVSSWNITNVTSMTSIFFSADSFSTDHYDALLNVWSQKVLQTDVRFDAPLVKYSSNATVNRQYIIDTYGWTINDAGLNITVQEIAQAKIEDYADNSTNPTPTLQDYIDAGVVGVTEENLEAVNSAVNDAESAEVDTVAELNSIVEAVNNANNVGGLLINELSSGVYTNSPRWFELYNASDSSIDLSDYTLKSRYYDGSNSGTFEFSLPSKNIPAGGYLVVRPNYGPAYNTTLADIENDKVIYLKDSASTKYPVWYSTSNGFLELLKDGQTADFVTFGSAYTPTTATAWSGSEVPVFGSEEWKSIARNINSTDTNQASDWAERVFQTYGGLNDVTCSDDVDEDGIPDCSEVQGATYAGLDLYSFGARVNQKDIFIEVDYIDSTNGGVLELDEGTVPHQKALEKVRDAFLANGYAVHFDVGDLFTQNGSTLNPALMDLGGGNQVAYAKATNLGCTNDGVDARSYKVDNMQVNRKQIFYYMLFGLSQNSDGSAGSSGCAEMLGNDSLMTLGGWNLNTNSVQDTNVLINFQAGTVMHEFGHNLGLDHGGNEGKNYKPNYVSIMNYLYQLQGLPTIGDNEGDRYYADSSNNGCSTVSNSVGMTNPFWENSDNFRLDYSHGNANTLDEVNGIVEENGLGLPNSGTVDYNCNQSVNDTLIDFNVNKDGLTDTLHDHDDWSAINIVFSRTYSGSSGITNKLSQQVSKVEHPVWNDIQPVAKEEPITIPSVIHFQ